MGYWVVDADVGRIVRLGAIVLGCLALADCSSSSSKYSPRIFSDSQPIPKGGGRYSVGQPYRINGRTYYPTENMSYRAEGIASWYGPDFHGRLTANGEIFDMHSISAAHTTMPIPSYARVTNLDNGRSIIVRVNDRGPYAQNRIIDLSIGAAKALNFYGEGLAHVRVEYVGRAPLEGSDDRMLLATLRTGTPAPSPDGVMLASAQASGSDSPPMPAERPFSLGTTPSRVATRSSDRTSASDVPSVRQVQTVQVQTVPIFRSPDSPPAQQAAANGSQAGQPARAAAFAPIRSGGSVDLMSGRGLY